MPATNKVYLPLVQGPSAPPPFYGLAWANQPPADLSLLAADWFYVWGESLLSLQGLQSVPMLRPGWAGRLPASYSGPLLFLNEPNVTIQDNLSPAAAAADFRRVKERYPAAQPVVGNVSIWATRWLREFAQLEPVTRVGVHCYLEAGFGVAYCDRELERLHADLGVPIWVTEFNNVSPALEPFCDLLAMLESKPWVERIAPFTNRQLGDWWDLPHCSLVAADGSLLPKGRAYVERRQRSDYPAGV